MTEPEVQPGTGAPDHWQRLWTPERLAYIQAGTPDDHCPFCRIPGESDEDGLVVFRGDTAYVVLNLYPYNAGHLMTVPFRHIADYPDLTPEETVEIARLTQISMRVIREVTNAQGFNLGMNQGVVAGAGIAPHLHQHVVPRWGGDTNFMPVIARTRVLPQLLRDTRALLADAWPAGDATGR